MAAVVPASTLGIPLPRGASVFDTPQPIAALVALLERREACLWHACQLADLHSYLQLGGIPSRYRLERSHRTYTAFDTDPRDRAAGTWDKVFFNLDDYGYAFASGWAATPNAYGPITLQVRPQVLRAASDVAICLRSAGAKDYDRSGESLSTIDDVDRLFRWPPRTGFPASTWTRYGEALKAEFPGRNAGVTSCEVSSTFPSTSRTGAGVASAEHIVVLWVDRIEVEGVSLPLVVRDVCSAAGLAVPVRPRTVTAERQTVLVDIVSVLQESQIRLAQLRGRHDVSPETREWAGRVAERGLEWQWDRRPRARSGAARVYGLSSAQYGRTGSRNIDGSLR
jgi:hypothetical protein